jgi:hypothetical protein
VCTCKSVHAGVYACVCVCVCMCAYIYMFVHVCHIRNYHKASNCHSRSHATIREERGRACSNMCVVCVYVCVCVCVFVYTSWEDRMSSALNHESIATLWVCLVGLV